MTAVLALGAVGMLPAEKKSIPAKAVGSESLSGYKSMRVKSDEEGYDFLVYYPDKYDIVDSDVILDSYVEDHCTLLKGITIGADLPGGWFKLGVKVYDKVYNKVSLTYDSQDFYPDLEEDGKTKEALEKPGHVKNRMLTGTGSYYNGVEWKELFEVSKDENLWRYKNFEKVVIDIDGPEIPWHYYTAKLTGKKLDKQADFLSATNMTSFEKDDRIHLSYGSTTGGKVYEDPLSDDSFDPPYDKFNKYVGSVAISKLIKDDDGNLVYDWTGTWNPNYKNHSSVDIIEPDGYFCLMGTDGVGDFWVDASALGAGTYEMKMNYVIQYFPLLKELYKRWPDYSQTDMDENRSYIYMSRYDYSETFRFTVEGKETPVIDPTDPTDPSPGKITLTVTAPKKAVSFKATKKKNGKKVLAKNRSFTIKAKANTSVKYSIASYPKGMKKYISLSKKSGKSTKVTIKKGAAKGTYKIKVAALSTGSGGEAPIYVTAKVK